MDDQRTRTIGIYLYPQAEVLDFAGPFEVFNTASRMALRQRPWQPKPFEVVTVSRDGSPLLARGGLLVTPQVVLHNAPALDVLLVPGGVVEDELADEQLLAWLRQRGAAAEVCASVCTGAFLLAKAGLADGVPVTTHWEDIDDLRGRFANLEVRENARWVDAGKVVTSAGISAGIDMSLHLVERLAGRALAEQTARQMEYVWQE